MSPTDQVMVTQFFKLYIYFIVNPNGIQITHTFQKTNFHTHMRLLTSQKATDQYFPCFHLFYLHVFNQMSVFYCISIQLHADVFERTAGISGQSGNNKTHGSRS
ncbi:hypothetical protein ATANTOWER_010328 [Ataeniobius toweri]|uniref:Uncharacterized protein n=1 Tax=Ataeniobius toweri TaxID=208326 RepID=A0ABU7BV58_9TELE|nr:hypothetical protein [Ataeniobius toweri]